jgi:hypothetical protein
VEGGGGGLTVSGVSRNRGGFVKCVAIQKRLGTPVLHESVNIVKTSFCSSDFQGQLSWKACLVIILALTVGVEEEKKWRWMKE